MEIAPSQNENLAVSASDIIIINNQNPLQSGVSGATRTTFLNLNFNNGGSKSTGANILNLSLSQDNLLAVNDNIYISYSENADSLFNTDKKDKNLSYGLSRDYPAFDFFNNDGGKKKFSKSLYSSFSFPFGFWSFSAALSYSTYKSSVEGEIAKFHLTGQSLAQTYSADRVILRSKIYRLNLGASLELKDSQSYIRDALSQTASARRNSAALYLNNVLYTKFGTLIFKPSYHKGLGLFGAKTDSRAHSGFDMVDSDPKLQYNLLKFYLYFNAPINIPLLTKNQERQERNTLPLFYNLTIDSQYSFDALYGNEQFSAGGQYSVRGFKESVISGDNGFYMRNDLRVSLLNIFPDILKETSVFKRKRAFLFEESPQTVLSKTQFSLFYDLGYVANKYRTVYDAIYDSQSGFMSGCGISLSYYGRYLNFSLTYSKALSSPEYLQARDGINKEDSSLYWKIGASW
jgi:hemolysin activation/secretion protein